MSILAGVLFCFLLGFLMGTIIGASEANNVELDILRAVLRDRETKRYWPLHIETFYNVIRDKKHVVSVPGKWVKWIGR